MYKGGTPLVAIVIPIFILKVHACCGESSRMEVMNKESLEVSIFFIFFLGAGLGFYIARILF